MPECNNETKQSSTSTFKRMCLNGRLVWYRDNGLGSVVFCLNSMCLPRCGLHTAQEWRLLCLLSHISEHGHYNVKIIQRTALCLRFSPEMLIPLYTIQEFLTAL